MRKFTADFETNVCEKDCRIWAYSICEIGNPENFIYGNNMEDFIKFCSNKKENYLLYFHNLKFDGEFIISYLLNNDFKWIKSSKERKDKTFTTLITDMGQFYSLEIYFEVLKKRINKVTIYDSLKILNFSVDDIAKSFNLPCQKLALDYETFREKGHILTEHEIDYIRNDVEIMARALDIMFKKDLTKMTIGSNALSMYRKMNKNFFHYFPELDNLIDSEIRRSYKGGFTYLNPIYKDKEVENGLVLDVNSLYPSVLKNEKMPIGSPLFFKGKYKEDKLYNLYVQCFSCSFEVKKGMIPTLQIKNNMSYKPNEYLTSSNGQIETLTLTNIDLELFLKHYDVEDLTFHSGYKFKSFKGLFNEYIDFWTNEKINAKKENNKPLYLISKLLLNSLYGKFGTSPISKCKMPFLDKDGIVKYKILEEEQKKTIYMPVATFVTSYARRKTIETSQKIKDYTLEKYKKDYYIYSDTDSIHMLDMDAEELKQFVDIDDYRLGSWKLESRFKKGKFLRQKCYIEESYKNEINTTIAGLPKKMGKYINFENFDIGFTSENMKIEKGDEKLAFKHVKGGIILVPTDFTIKEK